MRDAVTWEDIWLVGLGSALVGGIAAGVVARLTVYWTQRGDRRRAALVASWDAAGALTRSANSTFNTLGQARFASDVDIGPWLSEVLVQLPMLTDTEAARRVNILNEDFTNYAFWLREPLTKRPVADGLILPNGFESELAEYKDVLGQRYAWVGRSLSAHRRGEPLPPEDQLPDLPHLPMYEIR
jgi:hypothetical protein